MATAASSAVRLAKLAAKYGPHAVEAWKLGGSHAVDAVKEQQTRNKNRRHALDKARTVTDGSVLRQRHNEEIVWVVFAGDEPVAVYPNVAVPMADLIQHADLTKRLTPEQVDSKRVRRRVQRASARVTSKVGPHRSDRTSKRGELGQH